MSMRVQYTIPGVEYTSPTGPVESGGRLGELERAPDSGWRDVLGLNGRQPDDLMLGPPPRPAALSYTDAAEVRRQWASLMQRHAGAPPATGPEARMLETLAGLYEREMDLQARILAEPKE